MSHTQNRTLRRPSRWVAFRNTRIRLVGIQGRTWFCVTDIGDAIGEASLHKYIPQRVWDRSECVSANIEGDRGLTTWLCVTLEGAKSMSSASMVPSEDVHALWDWLDAQSRKWVPADPYPSDRKKISADAVKAAAEAIAMAMAAR
jgi:hypothetical protein